MTRGFVSQILVWGGKGGPEGAATVSAARKLAASGWIRPEDRVVLFNTGTGYKYAEAWGKALEA